MPIVFYVLPEDSKKAPGLIAEQKKYLAYYEKYLGPYPFRSQKIGIVETPHLGMEHSTDIAYGNQFKYNDDGIDWLLLHEFGHEWWANLVTAVRLARFLDPRRLSIVYGHALSGIPER